jgi:hypothetical protein
MQCGGRAFVRLTPDLRSPEPFFDQKTGNAELHNQPSEQNKDCELSC